MQLISAIFVSALLLASEASAAATTKSFVTCITKNGPKPVATVKTTSRILTVPFYGFMFTTTTPTRVITPAPTTTTFTVTWTSVTTLTSTQETDTFSETVTNTNTITTTSTELSSMTSSNTVTVTSTPITTLAAPAGFQPIRSSFPNSVKRRAHDQPEDASNGSTLEERAQGRTRISFKNGKAQCSPAVYPTAVTCAGIAKVITTSTITRTAKTKTKTALKPTSTVTTTKSFIRTTTLTPIHASTTLSFTTSTVITETQVQSTTTTFSATQTVEVVAPTSTYYAACGPDNMISNVNGAVVTALSLSFGQDLQVIDAMSPYDCCTSCIGTSGCSGTLYVRTSSGQCTLLMQAPGKCSVSALGAQFWTAEGTPNDSLVFSNGLCGRFYV